MLAWLMLAMQTGINISTIIIFMPYFKVFLAISGRNFYKHDTDQGKQVSHRQR
jgi:hypothetical protein